MWEGRRRKASPYPDQVRFYDGKIDGKSACNYVHAKVKQTGGTLEFAGRPTITAMSCGRDRTPATRQRWAAEQDYLNAFLAIRSYTLSGDTLLLTGTGGRVLMRLTK